MTDQGVRNVLSEVIRRVVREGWTTQQEIAAVSQVSEATVSRWASDDGVPRYDSFLALCHHHPDHKARDAFARLVPRHSEDQPTDAELDVNHDGRIDAADISAQSVQVAEDVAMLTRIVDVVRRANDLTKPVSAELADELDTLGQTLERDGSILRGLAEQVRERRRQASPLKMAGGGS